MGGKVRGNRPVWYTIVYLSYQGFLGKSRRPPGRKNGNSPGKWERTRGQKGQPQKGGGKGPGGRERSAGPREWNRAQRPGCRQKGRRAQKGRDGEIPSRRFVLLLPCLPLDALRAAGRRNALSLNKPASRRDSFPAGPWESAPAPAKIPIFAGPPIASPAPEMNPGPGKGLTGDPWTP